MAFSDHERSLLNDSLRRFSEEHYELHQRRAVVAEACGYSRENWRHFAELGWLGIGVTESDGGAGGSLADQCLVMEAAGRSLMAEPLLESCVLGARLLESGQQHSRFDGTLAAIADGSCVVTLAHYERDGGFDRGWIKTTASETGDGFSISGSKTAVAHAAFADFILISARDNGSQLCLFSVKRGSPGMRLSSARAVDGTPIAEIYFNDMLVGRDSRLGEDATSVIWDGLDRATIALCARSLGAMRVAFEMTLQYVRFRNQFGAPLSALQTVRHRLVDMYIAITQAAALTADAIEKADAEYTDWHLAASAAKIAVNRAAKLIGEQSIQLHGGMGMTDTLAIGHYYKHLLVAAGMFGDSAWHLERLASWYA